MSARWTSACTEESFRLICSGVFVPVPVLPEPWSLRLFLERVLGMERDYAETRVLTLLLNGLAADGLDALLPPGARLGLSAAMPGVAGATLRRSGRYAAMRRDISLDARPAVAAHTGPFWVELRCFNAIAAEQGMRIVRRGVAAPAIRPGPALRALAVSLPPHLPAPPESNLMWLACPETCCAVAPTSL